MERTTNVSSQTQDKNKNEDKNKDFSATLKRLKDQAGPKEVELIEVVTSMYESVKNSQEKAMDKISDATQKVTDSVHEHPWYYIGGAAAAGIILGMLMGRCRD